ncbi:MAG: fatty acid desaturase [Chitinophagales bacterium]
MAFIDDVLQTPSYGWKNSKGELIIPTLKQLFKEALHRINIFRDRRNWTSFFSPFIIICLSPFLYMFIVHYFSWPLLIVFILYTMIVMGTHGTVWFHRYCTHKAYKFSHPIWRIITQNMVIRTISEEMYVISHHVHHAKADKPGDPYNSRGGLMYCMLAEMNHQSISKDMSELDYNKTSRFLSNSGNVINSYRQYRYWGSVSSPYYTVAIWLLNWSCWFTILYFIGGFALACTIFSSAMLWFIFIRAFNFTGHGKGKVKHVDGLDYDRTNLAVNQSRPGMLTGEWHNNHHLYPTSARAGFLPYQLDLAWIAIFCMYKLKLVSSYHDSKKEFLSKYRQTKVKEIANP